MKWGACVHRLDLGLYSHWKEFGVGGGGEGVESEPMLTLGVEGGGGLYQSPEEDRTHDAASRRTASPTHYRLSNSGPQRARYLLIFPFWR